MARRRGRSHFVRPAPRSMVWLSAGLVTTTVGASSVVLLQVLNAAALALRPFTIIRNRLAIKYGMASFGATGSSQAVFSLQVVTEVAAAGGVGNVPTPITEPSDDYLIYQPLFAAVSFGDGTGFETRDGPGTQGWIVDSKAMRKVGLGDQAVQVIENRSAFVAQIAIEGRMLIKLH